MFGDPMGMFYSGITHDAGMDYEDMYSREGSNFSKDANYYHTRIEFSSILSETEKSYLVAYRNEELWIPKKICRNVDLENKSMFVHKNIFSQILYKSVEGNPVLQKRV